MIQHSFQKFSTTAEILNNQWTFHQWASKDPGLRLKLFALTLSGTLWTIRKYPDRRPSIHLGNARVLLIYIQLL